MLALATHLNIAYSVFLYLDPGVNALLVGGCNPLDDPELEVRLAVLEPLLDVFLTCIALPARISCEVLDICKEVSFESLPVSSTNSFR